MTRTHLKKPPASIATSERTMKQVLRTNGRPATLKMRFLFGLKYTKLSGKRGNLQGSSAHCEQAKITLNFIVGSTKHHDGNKLKNGCGFSKWKDIVTLSVIGARFLSTIWNI